MNTVSNNPPTELQCPTCQAKVLWNNEFPHRPFCSQRCQLVDFGEWAKENHRIGSKDNPEFNEAEPWDTDVQ